MTMTIAGSSVHLSGQSDLVVRDEVKESLRMWVGDRRPDFESRRGESRQGRMQGDTVSLSVAGRHALSGTRGDDAQAGIRSKEELLQEMLTRMIESLTGKKVHIRLFSMQELEAAQAVAMPDRAGFGIEYDRHEVHYEAEKTTFQADGLIKTQDGRELAVSLDLSMSRQFMREQDVSLRYGDALLKDPLVLNFDGKATELTTTRYSFDIDSDGQLDRIAFVAPGSGFLALDRDGDGTIDDGGELFGAGSGQGFAELARYDEDGNRWIDANDPIYRSLLIWSKDAEGHDHLAGLAALGVGALYLDHVETPFSLKDDGNALLGRVRESGMYLRENASAGVIQQIDLDV